MKALKFNTTKDSNVFFFSDFHASHERDFILGPRGFKDAKEAKETLIKNWNSKVTCNDIVFLLGDTVVGAGTEALNVFNELLFSLNYKAIYIMPGNHPSGYTQKFYEVLNMNGIDDFYRLSFRPSDHQDKMAHLIPNYFEITVDNKFIVLSHYPIFSYNNISKNAWMLFGHCHNNLSKSELGKEYLKGKVLDVGPESIGNFPISFSELSVILNLKENLDIDHHSK